MPTRSYKVISKDGIQSEVVDVRNSAKSFTLEEIEEKMMQLANTDSNDVVVNMINEKKISMLEKVANLRMKRMMLEDQLKNREIETAEVTPIAVRFINSKSDEQNERLEHTDKEIASKRTIRQDA